MAKIISDPILDGLASNNQPNRGIDTFLELYYELSRTLERINDPGQSERARRLMGKVDNAFYALSQEDRNAATHTLMRGRYLPDIVSEAINMFNGKVVGI